MSSRRLRVLFILAAVGLVIALAWVLPILRRDDGPIYKGRSLNYWLARTKGGTTNEQELYAAVDFIGTNALPFLVSWIRYERPEWRQALYEKAPQSFEELSIGSAERRADASVDALIHLGSNAAPAFQRLKMMARNQGAPETAQRAMSALASIGPDGIQELLTTAQDTNNPTWDLALAVLGHPPVSDQIPLNDQTPLIDPFQPLRVAALTRLIGETNPPDMRSAAALCLGLQVNLPTLALPPLLHCITNQDADFRLRLVATGVVPRFGSNAASTLSVLTNALTDPSAPVRRAATNAINEIVNPKAKRLRTVD